MEKCTYIICFENNYLVLTIDFELMYLKYLHIINISHNLTIYTIHHR